MIRIEDGYMRKEELTSKEAVERKYLTEERSRSERAETR